MRSQVNFENARLIEALDYIDRDLIAEVVEEIKAPDMKQSPERDKKITRKSIRYALTLAACLVLISAIIPVASYVISHFDLFPAGIGGETSTESTVDIPEEHIKRAKYPLFVSDLEPISDEMIEEVKEAFYQKVYSFEYDAWANYYSKSNLDEDGKLSSTNLAAKKSAEYYRDILFSTEEEDHFIGRYYGMIGNCVIFAINTYLEGEYNVISIGNTRIENDNSIYILAYRDGKVKTLENAYEAEWLTDENIEKIKERHGQFNAFAYWKKGRQPIYHYARFTPELENLSYDTIEEINNYVFETKFAEQFSFSVENDRTYTNLYNDRRITRERLASEAYASAKSASDVFVKDDRVSLKSYEESFRYYGTFSGKVIWANVSDLTAVTQFTLNGLYFFYSTQTSHYVYVNGEVMDLMNAYEKGLLTEADVINLHYRYCVYNSYIDKPNRERSEDSYATFTVTPEQDAIISDIFGSFYSVSFGHWDEYLGKCLNKEEADIWNSTAPSDILSVLEFFGQDSRFFKLWRTALNDSSFAKVYYISITPEQDAIITELVDEKYKCYAGYWDIWLYKALDPMSIFEWNSMNPSTRDEINKFMEEKTLSRKLEISVPVYPQ